MEKILTPHVAAMALQEQIDLVDPALIKRGVRIFVFTLAKALKFYGKYQAVINPVLPAGVAAALSTLVAVLAELALLNRPGPE